MVVAAGASDGQTQENRARCRGHLIQVSLSDLVRGAAKIPGCQPQKSHRNVSLNIRLVPGFAAVLVAARQLKHHKPIVSQIGIEGFDYPISIPPGVAEDNVPFHAVRFSVTDQVQPVATPTLPVSGIGQQRFHQLVVGVRRGISEKSMHFLGRGGHPDQIQIEPPRQGPLGGRGSRPQPFLLLHLA